jgi:hypothetical protein
MPANEKDDLRAFIDRLHEDDLEQARQMSGSDKLAAGGDLFDEACEWTLAGIKHQHPDWTHEQAIEELRVRVHGQGVHG